MNEFITGIIQTDGKAILAYIALAMAMLYVIRLIRNFVGV